MGRYQGWAAHPLILLPSEILLTINDNLAGADRMILRGVSRFFSDFILRATHAELLAIETEDWTKKSSLGEFYTWWLRTTAAC